MNFMIRIILIYLINTTLVYGIDSNIVKQHDVIFSDIEKQIYNERYTFNNPLIIVNPYNISPLTAYIIFSTQDYKKVNVIINEKDRCHLSYSTNKISRNHLIPIFGLIQGNNTVKLKIKNNYNSFEKEFRIKTDKIKFNAEIKVIKGRNIKCKNKMIFISQTYPGQPSFNFFAFNKNGHVIWTLNDNKIGASSSLFKDENGYLLVNSNKNNKRPYYFSSYYKINLIGRIVQEINNYGYGHHEIIQLPNENYLALVDDLNQNTIEDRVVELDKNGKSLNIWDFKQILNLDKIEAPEIYKYYALNNKQSAANKDWIHLNSLTYDDIDESIIVSSRSLNAIIKIGYNDKKIKWILTDPNQDWITAQQRKFILKPLIKKNTTPFIYGQHSISLLDKNTILVFDNGLHYDLFRRNIYKPNKIYNLKNNRSRVLKFSIIENKMFDYEVIHEKNYHYYSTFLGSASKSNGNYLINYGGILKENGNPSDNIRKILFGEIKNSIGYSSIFEIKNNKEIFNADIKSNGISTTYRARMFNVTDFLTN